MQLALRGSLPFVTITATHDGKTIQVTDILVDTGSASTVFSADVMVRLSVVPQPSDRLRTLRGIGGRELVFTRRLDRIEVDGHELTSFEVEVGGMDYGFGIKGILGMDFLRAARAIVNLRDLTISWG